MDRPVCSPSGRLDRHAVAKDPELSRISSQRLVDELLSRTLADEFDANPDVYEHYVDGFAQLGLELQRRLDVDSNRFSRANVSTRLRAYCAAGSSGPPPVRDATVVELGCGGRNPMSVLFAFVLLGARRCIGVDLDTVADVPEAVRALARVAGWMLTDPRLLVADFPITRAQVAAHLAATSFDLARLFAGEAAGVDRSRLDFRNESVTRMSFADGEVDLCGSTSFLEHVDDAEAALAEIARVTRRGGRGVHCIDGLDHRNYVAKEIHPLEFLRDPTDAPVVHGCNRVRPLAFLPLFERHGFEVRHVEQWRRTPLDAATRASFAPRFRSLSEEVLACTGATIWVQKP